MLHRPPGSHVCGSHLGARHPLGRLTAFVSRRRRPQVGKPLRNERIYIVNKAMQLQPPGVPGEICIGGAGVTLGYAGNTELTAAKFVPDPFAKVRLRPL